MIISQIDFGTRMSLFFEYLSIERLQNRCNGSSDLAGRGGESQGRYLSAFGRIIPPQHFYDRFKNPMSCRRFEHADFTKDEA